MNQSRFDWIVSSLGLVFVTGLFVDGWAHNHVPKLESFFTPWHAVFYGGFALLALFISAYALARRRRGVAWSATLPSGYEWTAIGLATFVISGFCDMLWHMRYGLEASTSVLFSPPHLGIAASMALILGGPFAAATAAEPPQRNRVWPAMLSLTCAFCVVTFFSQYATPLSPLGTGRPFIFLRDTLEALGALVMLWATALFMGAVLLALARWRWRLPFGALTLLFTLNAALMALQNDAYRMIPAVALSGLIADLLVQLLKPSTARRGALYAFAFAVPVVYWVLHDLTLVVSGLKFYYPAPMLSGTVVACGIVGLLLTLLLRRPGDVQSEVIA